LQGWFGRGKLGARKARSGLRRSKWKRRCNRDCSRLPIVNSGRWSSVVSNQESSALQKVRSPRIAGLSPEKYAELVAIGRDTVIGWRVFLEGMFKATCTQLERHGREITDERSALAAVDFCRFLQTAGVVELLTRYRDEGQDFSRVKALISDVSEQAGPWLRGSRVVARAPAVELAEVHEKLDAILAAVARPALQLRSGDREPRWHL